MSCTLSAYIQNNSGTMGTACDNCSNNMPNHAHVSAKQLHKQCNIYNKQNRWTISKNAE